MYMTLATNLEVRMSTLTEKKKKKEAQSKNKTKQNHTHQQQHVIDTQAGLLRSRWPAGLDEMERGRMAQIAF